MPGPCSVTDQGCVPGQMLGPPRKKSCGCQSCGEGNGSGVGGSQFWRGGAPTLQAHAVGLKVWAGTEPIGPAGPGSGENGAGACGPAAQCGCPPEVLCRRPWTQHTLIEECTLCGMPHGCGCGCGGEGCGCAGGGCAGGCGCGCAGAANGIGPAGRPVSVASGWGDGGYWGLPKALHRAVELAQWAAEPVAPPAASCASGCAALGADCRVNLYNRNLVLQIRPPESGLYHPRLIVTYNARHSGTDFISTEFGTGWFGTYNQKIKPHAGGIGLTGPVDVFKPSHLVWHYDPATMGSSTYVPPKGAVNGLVKNANGTWTETQPDGFKLHYEDASGMTLRLKKLNNRAGSTWTLSYMANGKLSYITDPFSRRTTFTYDAADKIRLMTDSGGRVTTFSVLDSDLVKQGDCAMLGNLA